MTLQWYALRSKPNKEAVVWQQTKSKQIEVFYPRLKVTPANPRSRKVRPYFPGYMFVHTDLEQTGLSLFQWLPFSLGLVRFDSEPASVPDALITGIRKRVGEIVEAGGEIFADLNPGDAVYLHSGPFAGYRAIFDARLPGSERVRVLLKFLSDYPVPVELHAGQMRKL